MTENNYEAIKMRLAHQRKYDYDKITAECEFIRETYQLTSEEALEMMKIRILQKIAGNI